MTPSNIVVFFNLCAGDMYEVDFYSYFVSCLRCERSRCRGNVDRLKVTVVCFNLKARCRLFPVTVVLFPKLLLFFPAQSRNLSESFFTSSDERSEMRKRCEARPLLLLAATLPRAAGCLTHLLSLRWCLLHVGATLQPACPTFFTRPEPDWLAAACQLTPNPHFNGVWNLK